MIERSSIVTRRLLAMAMAAGVAAVASSGLRPAAGADKKRVFVITRAQGFAHSSRPTAAATVKALGEETGDWTVVGQAETSQEVAAALTADRLKDVDLVFFANTTGNL